MIKIRLSGTMVECEAAYFEIKKTFNVLYCSNAYDNTRKCVSSQYVRVYLDCELKLKDNKNMIETNN